MEELKAEAQAGYALKVECAGKDAVIVDLEKQKAAL